MPQNDDVYVLPDEDILESLLKKQPGRRTRPDAGPAIPLASAPTSTVVSQRTAIPIAPRVSSPSASGVYQAPPRSSRLSRASIASTLSILACGGGQIYNGQTQLGLLFLLTEALAVAAHWSAARIWPSILEMAEIFSVSERSLLIGAAVADAVLALIFIGNVAQAYHRAASTADDAEPVFQTPLLPGLASLVVPGWGQILNAQLPKALFFLFLLLAEAYVVALAAFPPMWRIVGETRLGERISSEPAIAVAVLVAAVLNTWLLSVYDAVLVSSHRRRMAGA